MLNVGGPELLIILLVALVFLGPQRLPDLARQMGQTMSSLRSLASGFQAEIEAAAKPDGPVSDGAASEAATSDDAASMTLDGPIDQAEAIAKTQPAGTASASTDTSTDTKALKEAARAVDHGTEEERAVSAGGPTDLQADDMTGADEEE